LRIGDLVQGAFDVHQEEAFLPHERFDILRRLFLKTSALDRIPRPKSNRGEEALPEILSRFSECQ
jgi:hypothetical protein